MKAEELMIGDWVLISPMDCDPVAKRVTAINYNSYLGKDYCDWINVDNWDELSEKEIQPIPLKADLLEKNGFVGHAYGYSIENFKLYGNLDEDNVAYFTIPIDKKHIRIEYIHQLQHALKLCGIDKEIVL